MTFPQTIRPLQARYQLHLTSILAATALLATVGCQVQQIPGVSTISVSPAFLLEGHVMGGQQAVSQANVQLMAVGTSGDGSAATSVMTKSVTTDANGKFSLAGSINCAPTSEQVYLLVTGGNPGLALGSNNPQLAMMTALGPCNALTSSTTIAVNELTTVASVAALLPYMSGDTSVGSSSTDAPSLASAFASVSNYVNTSNATVPGPTLPPGSTASTQTLIALANAVAACVNSTGGAAGDNSNCGNLFSDAKLPSGVYPTDTIGALIGILSNPAANTSSLFGLISDTPPFSGGSVQTPANWSLPVLGGTSTSVQFAAPTYSVQEAAGTVTLTVTRSASGGPATVNYTTISGSALPGTDYPATTGTLTWASGDTSAKSLTVPINNTGATGGTRSFTVALNTPSAVTLGTVPSAQVNITENDTALSVANTATSGTQYLAYSTALSASGGVGSLSWTFMGGTLPTGLSLTSNGQLSGTPTSSGAYSFSVKVQDQASPTPQSVTQTISLSITSLASAVAALPSSTSDQLIKNAVLNWGISGAASLAAEGDNTDSLSLYQDVANNLATTFTIPTTLPPAYFPTIPSVATNPMVTAANSSIASSLATDSSSPLPWDNQGITLASGTAATYLATAQNMMTALLTPGQKYYLNPALVPAILNRLEDADYLVQTSDFADINTDSQLPYTYLMLSQGFPQLMLASRAAAWKATIAQNTNYEINGSTALGLTAYGAYFTAAATNSNIANWWINSDVRHMAAIEYGGIIAGNASNYTSYIQGALHELQFATQPDGGMNYTDQQTDSYTYHPINVTELARYTQVTGDTTGNSIVIKTRNYEPLTNLQPIGGEYISAPSWKKYWNVVLANDGAAVVVGLTGDPYNLQIIQNAGWPDSYFCAQYYNSSATAQALPSNWITYDQNTMGPRGMQGNFMYLGVTRPTPSVTKGRETYVGGLIVNQTTDAYSAGGNNYSLNAAVESAGSLVLTTSGAELVSSNNYGATETMANEALSENNASTTYGSTTSGTPYFGAVSTSHGLSGYEQAASGWTENEAWVLLPTRVIGFVNLKNSSGKSLTACEIDGGIKLVSGRATWGTAKSWSTPASNQWQYGNMLVDVFATDYTSNHQPSSTTNPVTFRTELTGTWEDNANKAGWLILEDANNQPTDTALTAPATSCVNASGTKTTGFSYPAGYSHYFLADFRPATSAAASAVSQLTGLPTGLIGFTFVDGSVTYTMVANTTAAAISYTPPSNTTVVMSGNQSRASWIDPTCSACVTGGTYSGTVPAYSHIVAFH